MEDETDLIERREALVGLALIGVLSTVLVGTILVRIVSSQPPKQAAPSAAIATQTARPTPGTAESPAVRAAPAAMSAADPPDFIHDVDVGAAAHNEPLRTQPQFIAPHKGR